MACPHDGLQVGGRCYWCCKVAATNGHRSKLTPDQLAWAGFVPGQDRSPSPAPTGRSTLDLAMRHIDQQLDELAARRDIAPGWFRLAAKILEEDSS